MTTLKEWIEKESDGEAIESIVFGDDRNNWGGLPVGVLLSLESAMPWLVREFYSGFGIANCPAMVAWTKTWIISVSEYDGATSHFRIPRKPTAYFPSMP